MPETIMIKKQQSQITSPPQLNSPSPQQLQQPPPLLPLIVKDEEEDPLPYRINNCKFQNSVISFLSDLHDTRAYTDVSLHAEGRFIPAHKIVLAAGSSYFNSLFKSLYSSPSTSTNNDQHPHLHNPHGNVIIALPQVKYKDLTLILKFLYCGYIDIKNADLESFVTLCKELGVVGMVTDEEEAPKNVADEQRADGDEDEAELYVQQQQPSSSNHQDYQQIVTFSNDGDGEDDQEETSAPLLDLFDNSTPNNYLNDDLLDDDDEGEVDDDEDDDDLLYQQQQQRIPSTSSNSYYLDSSCDDGNNGDGGGGSMMMIIDQQQPNNSNKPYACTKCGKTYNSNKSLWRHKKFTCDEKIEFKCSVCGKVFSRSDNLRRHVVVAHHHH